MKPILVADPRAAMLARGDALRAAFDRVLGSGHYILGAEVQAFERLWAARCGTAHAVGLSSGTDALALALRATGITAGDHVLVPAMTALATWMAVAQVGAVPVGVDVDPVRGAMDPEAARRAANSRTRAVIAVHLYGFPAPVDALADVAAASGAVLIEDAAQAHGAQLAGRPAGSLGAAAAFSFYPTKNLGTLGDAGAVTTSSAEVADRLQRLREYGWRTREDAELVGVNARLDELQAALLSALVLGLDAALARRATIARRYLADLADLSGLELPQPEPGTTPAWHLFPVRHPHRDSLAEALAVCGIGTGRHYATAPHQNTAITAAGWSGSFPTAERLAATTLSLPLHPGLSDADVDRVVDAVRRAC